VSEQPDNLVVHILREIRAEMAGVRSEMVTIRETMATKDEIQSLRADVASDIATLDAKIDRTRKDLSDQIVGLRRAVVEYHTTVVGHGVLISEMEGRLRRVEQTLGLAPEAR
jgi:hypothetical protein